VNASDAVHDAVVIGAGFGGLGAAAELQRSGVDDFLVLEQADRVGGVWRDNTYPGAACDTQSLIYCYSYFLHLGVSSMFAGQSELLDYLESFAAHFGLIERIRLGVRVIAARWSTEDELWELDTTAGHLRTRSVIAAWGQLGTPYVPDIPGRDSFRGQAFHSARWPAETDLAGLRIASIGNAASAVQYVPELARIASRVVVFQRSANYILPRNQIRFSDDERAAFLADPDIYRARRDDIHRLREEGFERTRHGTGAQAEGAREALEHLAAQVPDKHLRRKLTPTYEFGCKRILRSDDFYPALMRPDVDLVVDPIRRITDTGIETRSGENYEVDVIVYGTGFRSQAFQGDLVVEGRDGIDLATRWRTAAEAYLGVLVDGFPNLFLVYGPNTNLNHNSVVTMLEAQQRFIAEAVSELRDGAPVEVRPDVVSEFNDWVQQELEGSAYSADCSSWYKNDDGRVVNNWCGTVEEYRRMLERIDRAELVARR
jgi:cation diffusion facilitator CzcD-associated flavoprotein CzcO